MLIRRLKNDLLGERTKRKALRKGTTVNRYLQLLSKIFEMAFEEGLVDPNPMRRVPLEPEGEGLSHEATPLTRSLFRRCLLGPACLDFSEPWPDAPVPAFELG